jgi:hypothetical protein
MMTAGIKDTIMTINESVYVNISTDKRPTIQIITGNTQVLINFIYFFILNNNIIFQLVNN